MTVEIIETNVQTAPTSTVSWPAIFGGALVAVATTLVLFSLGSGLGFASASPWANAADTAGAVGIFAGIWLIVVQWLSSAVGGYLTGRLRSRWVGTHHHEVFFRDTAHGFLAWALATVLIAAIAVWAGSGLTSAAANIAAQKVPTNFTYDADALYRTPSGDITALAPVRAEAERILAASVVAGGLSDEDRGYLVSSITNRAGVAQVEAERRVTVVTARERQAADDARAAADKARKAAATAAIVTSLALLVGAFIASASAAVGGHQRDEHP
jgi:hypothetical protein